MMNLKMSFNSVKIVNFIETRPQKSCYFKILCQEMESLLDNLLLHTEARWLSQGNILPVYLNSTKNNFFFYRTQISFVFGTYWIWLAFEVGLFKWYFWKIQHLEFFHAGQCFWYFLCREGNWCNGKKDHSGKNKWKITTASRLKDYMHFCKIMRKTSDFTELKTQMSQYLNALKTRIKSTFCRWRNS